MTKKNYTLEEVLNMIWNTEDETDQEKIIIVDTRCHIKESSPKTATELLTNTKTIELCREVKCLCATNLTIDGSPCIQIQV